MKTVCFLLFFGSACGTASMEEKSAMVRRDAAPACAAGDTAACARSCDANGATETCEKACDANDMVSCRKLAFAYAHWGYTADGIPGGWPKDREEAGVLYEKACDQGDAQSCDEGGEMFAEVDDLRGEPALDVEKGAALLEKGCEIDPQAYAAMLKRPVDDWLSFTIATSCDHAGHVFRVQLQRPDLALKAYSRACVVDPKNCEMNNPTFKRLNNDTGW